MCNPSYLSLWPCTKCRLLQHQASPWRIVWAFMITINRTTFTRQGNIDYATFCVLMVSRFTLLLRPKRRKGCGQKRRGLISSFMGVRSMYVFTEMYQALTDLLLGIATIDNELLYLVLTFSLAPGRGTPWHSCTSWRQAGNIEIAIWWHLGRVWACCKGARFPEQWVAYDYGSCGPARC